MDNPQIVKIDLDDLCELVRDSLILNRLIEDYDYNEIQDYIYSFEITDGDVNDWLENYIIE